MANLALWQRVTDETTGLIDSVGPGQLGDSTPCTGWTVRDLINHITADAIMLSISAEQGSVSDEMMGELLGGDNLGDDYKGAWKAASGRALALFARPGALEKTMKLPFGEMPATNKPRER